MAERKVVLLKVLLLLSVSAPLSSAVRHCLRFYYTALTPGLDFREFTAEGLVDREPFVTFDSRTQKWIYQNEADDPKVWNRNTQDLEKEQKKVRAEVVEGLQSLGYTGGKDKVQWMFGCGLDDDGTKTGFWELGYDGEDLISLELKNGVWTGATDQAAIIKQNCETRSTAGFRKGYLENECIDWLQKFVKNYLSTQEGKGSRKRWSLDGCKERKVAGPSADAVPQTSGVTHSLQYFYTGVTGINFPEFTAVGLVDGGQFMYYDRNIGKAIPKTEWIQKVVGDDPGYWDRQTVGLQATQETFKVDVETLMQRFNQSKGVHTVQYMYGCELDDDGTKRGYDQIGYDGEDFLSLDLSTETFTAPVPQALLSKQKWERAGNAGSNKNYLENTCIEWLQKYVGYGRATLERKDPPEVSLFQKDSSSPVVCHATGFFPKSVMISWEKNGVELHEDFDLRETLPNEDGSFQKRNFLNVSPEELNRNQYTCVVHHSSLKEEIRKELKGGGVVGIIIAVVVALLLLVALCVGVFLWKKKKSGFKSVPVNPNGSSDGENSSTHS